MIRNRDVGLRRDLGLANHIIERFHLSNAFGHVSVRIPGTQTFLFPTRRSPACNPMSIAMSRVRRPSDFQRFAQRLRESWRRRAQLRVLGHELAAQALRRGKKARIVDGHRILPGNAQGP